MTTRQSLIIRYTRIYRKELYYEIIKLLREPIYVASIVGLPVLFFILFGLTKTNNFAPGGAASTYMLASCACFGAMGAAIFGLGVGLATERSQGWLDLKRSSPMPAYAYLLAKFFATFIFGELTIFLLVGLEWIITGHIAVSLTNFVSLMLAVSCGVFSFAAIGVFLGLIVPPSSAANTINLIYFPLCLCGGVWMPINMLPSWIQNISPYLPSYQFFQLSQFAVGLTNGDQWHSLVFLLAYGAFFSILSGLLFR